MPDSSEPYPLNYVGPWMPYRGRYEKRHHMIRTESGKEIGPCWPNAGDFTDLTGREIKGGAVVAFRPLAAEGDPYEQGPLDPTIYRQA